MLFKKRRKVFSDEVLDVSKICTTCKFASRLNAVEDLMCSKKGVVSPNFSCKHYYYNRLMKRPPKKRSLNSNRYSAEDFEI